MAEDKPPFKLTVTFESHRPDALQAALARMDTLSGEYDSVGKSKATTTIESFDEEALIGIRNGIEAYIRANRWNLDGKVTMNSPLIRPVKEQAPMVRFWEQSASTENDDEDGEESDDA